MKSTNIPIEVSAFVLKHKLYRAFAIYLRLKFHNDKIHGSEIKGVLDLDQRTIDKHLKSLLELNWIGYNPKSDTYHIRGFQYIREAQEFKRRRASVLLTRDINNIQIYLAGALICNAIMDQEYYKRSGTGTKKRGVPKQSPTFSYLALSSYKIAKIISCNHQSKACLIKNKAKKAGYISTKKQFKFISDDANYRKALYHVEPLEAMRMRLIQGKVYRQLPDEITPKIPFRKIKKLVLQEKYTDSRGC